MQRNINTVLYQFNHVMLNSFDFELSISDCNKMSGTENILYGGYEGSDEEICLNTKSLGEALMNSFNSSGERTVLVIDNISFVLTPFFIDIYIEQIDGVSGRTVSGNELKSKAIRLAKYMQQHFRIKSGDVISICSENRIEFAIAIHATLFLGATIAPLNHSYIKGMQI